MATLLFRCDAYPQLGYGHYARCKELAQKLTGRKPYFVGELDTYAQQELKALAIDFQLTPRLSQDDFGWLSSFGKEDVLLVDSYDMSASKAQQLASSGIRWGAFDDYNRWDFAGAHFVINFRITAEEWARYAVPHVFLGHSYMPIADAFVALRERRMQGIAEATPCRVLACIGGSDAHEVGPKLLQEIAGEPRFVLTVVDVGMNLPASYSGAKIVPKTPAIAELLASQDLALTGGGKIKYEACFALFPTVVLNQTAGEEADSRILAQRGLCLIAGNAWEYPQGAVVERLWQAHSERSRLLSACRAQFTARPSARLVESLEACLTS